MGACMCMCRNKCQVVGSWQEPELGVYPFWGSHNILSYSNIHIFVDALLPDKNGG